MSSPEGVAAAVISVTDSTFLRNTKLASVRYLSSTQIVNPETIKIYRHQEITDYIMSLRWIWGEKITKEACVSITEENSIRYLGIYIYSNRNWKSHINYIAKKVKSSIGTLSNLRYYLNSKNLVDLCYALVYPFLTYCIIAWGNTYQTSLQPFFVLQKKAVRIITFSSFFEHTSPLFKDLNVIKLFDEVTVHIDISSKFICITFSQYCRNHLVNL